MATTTWQELKKLIRRQPSLTVANAANILPTWEQYTWRWLGDERPAALPDDLPEPPADEPSETQAALDRALDRLSKLEAAVAPVIAVFREYLDDSFLPDDARVLMDELPLAGLSHGDLRRLMAVWDACEDEGAAA